MALCTLEDVKEYLSILTTNDDTLLQGCINTCRALITQYCGGRVFDVGSTEDTRKRVKYFSNQSNLIQGRALLLDYDELATEAEEVLIGGVDVTTSVKYYGDAPYTSLVLMGSSGYSWKDNIGMLDNEDAIQITGDWGYSLLPPDDVKQAAIIWSAYLYQLKDAAPDGSMSSAGIGSNLIPDYSKAIPANVAVLLNPYCAKW